jgi:hypothetical protein
MKPTTQTYIRKMNYSQGLKVHQLCKRSEVAGHMVPRATHFTNLVVP